MINDNAQMAAEEIIDLTSDRIISTRDISNIHVEVSVRAIPELIDIIRSHESATLKKYREALEEERQRSDRLFAAIVFYHTTMDKMLGDHHPDVKKATKILNTKVSEYALWLKARTALASGGGEGEKR